MKLTYKEALALAREWYTRGGDSFYECMDERDYEPMTREELIADFKRCNTYRREIESFAW